MDRKLGKELHIVSNKLCRKIDSIVSRYDLTHSQFAVMRYLIENNNKDIFQKDIEVEFGIRRSSVSAILSHLEEKDYINRSTVSKDARLKKISTTDNGEKNIREVTHRISALEKELLSFISPNDIEIFYSVLFKLSDVIDNI